MATPPQDAATLEVLRGILAGADVAAAGGSGGAEIERFLVHHGLAGLALAACRRAEARGLPPPLPESVRRALDPHRVRVALESRVRLETLERARRILRDAGVPSLAFKGAALLLDGTYREPAERAFEDVDLLVRPDDAEAAVDALIRHGFRPWTPWNASRAGWMSAFTLDDAETPPGLPATVDLHWSATYGALRLAPPHGPDPLWEEADPEPGLPSTEAHFVVLADHFLKHLRVVPHLRGFGDLCRLAPRLIDADALLRHARLRRSERGLATILRALVRLWGVEVRGDVIATAGADGGPTAAERRYLAPRSLLRTPPIPRSRLGGLVLRWRLGGGAAAALRDVAHVAAPSGAWLHARYPQSRGSMLGLRARYALALARWATGVGRSPLSPNQDVGVDVRAGKDAPSTRDDR